MRVVKGSPSFTPEFQIRGGFPRLLCDFGGRRVPVVCARNCFRFA
jgi:hypothetical protein